MGFVLLFLCYLASLLRLICNFSLVSTSCQYIKDIRIYLLFHAKRLITYQDEEQLPDVPVSDMDLPEAPTHELEKTS